MKNLAELVLKSVLQYPNRPLINKHLYGSLYNMIKKNDTILDQYKVGKQDRVCFLAEKGMDWVSVMTSCWLRGSVFVPLVNNNPPLNNYILDKVKPKVVLTKLSNNNSISNSSYDTKKMVQTSITTDANDPALILFTSGTTNDPKGVVLSHQNILSNLEMIDQMYNDSITSLDSSFSLLPWHHCYGLVCELLFLLKKGANIKIPTAKIPEEIFKEIRHQAPTLLFTVPKILESIYKRDVRFVPSFVKRNYVFGRKIRMMSVGGALCHPDLVTFMTEEFRVPTYQGYGMTETSPMISLSSPTYNKIGSVGKVLDNVNIHFREDQSIQVRGENCMLGYYKDTIDNQIICHEKEDWFDTGDKGYLDEDGFLFLDGRTKTEYKLSNGKYVNPVYLESILSLMPNINQVLVYGEGSSYNRAIIYADNHRPSKEEIQTFLQDKVEPYEIPREIYYIDEPFSLQNGLLTQKMEPHRKKILSKYT